MNQKLVLASASLRREMLLSQLGLDFKVRPSEVDEESFINLPPAVRVESLALVKARTVAGTLDAGLVIGADTIVVCGEEVLGKPTSAEEAEKMLSFLSGRTHTVYTGVAVVRAPDGAGKSTYASTEVTFCPISPNVIKAYVATGEPMDKAGAYGIQGRGALLVSEIKGDYYNVVGLPLVKTVELLEQFGLHIWGET